MNVLSDKILKCHTLHCRQQGKNDIIVEEIVAIFVLSDDEYTWWWNMERHKGQTRGLEDHLLGMLTFLFRLSKI